MDTTTVVTRVGSDSRECLLSLQERVDAAYEYMCRCFEAGPSGLVALGKASSEYYKLVSEYVDRTNGMMPRSK